LKNENGEQTDLVETYTGGKQLALAIGHVLLDLVRILEKAQDDYEAAQGRAADGFPLPE
jgi:hypothetical protein